MKSGNRTKLSPEEANPMDDNLHGLKDLFYISTDIAKPRKKERVNCLRNFFVAGNTDCVFCV